MTVLQMELVPALAPFAALQKPLHFISSPLLALGYLCLVVLLFHSRNAALVTIFAPVGRMALTNYVAQSFAIGFVLYKVDPALGLVGKIGPGWLMVIGVAIFAAQILFSRLWLARFAYGPLEWGWRALTYGVRPPMRIARNDAPFAVAGS